MTLPCPACGLVRTHRTARECIEALRGVIARYQIRVEALERKPDRKPCRIPVDPEEREMAQAALYHSADRARELALSKSEGEYERYRVRRAMEARKSG